MKKTNSKITSSALNKNKQQHLKQKKWLAKINEIKKKKKNWSKITWVAKNDLQIKKSGLQVKIMKETKNLEIGTEKINVSKKSFCLAKILLA